MDYHSVSFIRSVSFVRPKPTIYSFFVHNVKAIRLAIYSSLPKKNLYSASVQFVWKVFFALFPGKKIQTWINICLILLYIQLKNKNVPFCEYQFRSNAFIRHIFHQCPLEPFSFFVHFPPRPWHLCGINNSFLSSPWFKKHVINKFNFLVLYWISIHRMAPPNRSDE